MMNRTMDHEEAVRSHAAERYLLGELTGEEREAYEDHFFECSKCAEEIKSGDSFVQSARDGLKEDVKPGSKPAEFRALAAPRPGWQSSWWRPAPVFAFAALILIAAFSIYQNLVTIPRLQQTAVAQPVVSISLLSAGARGGAAPEFTVPEGRPISLAIAVPPGFSSYRCEISGSSQTAGCGMISAAQARDIVQILIPAGVLNEGPHALTLTGLGGAQPAPQAGKVAQYDFVLHFSR